MLCLATPQGYNGCDSAVLFAFKTTSCVWKCICINCQIDNNFSNKQFPLSMIIIGISQIENDKPLDTSLVESSVMEYFSVV